MQRETQSISRQPLLLLKFKMRAKKRQEVAQGLKVIRLPAEVLLIINN